MFLKEFISTSLCNVSYKVIVKVIRARIRPFLSNIIGPFQSSFIPSKGTTNIAILEQEEIHCIHQSRAEKGMFAIKVDLEKAYDRVSWRFLQETLVDFIGNPLSPYLFVLCIEHLASRINESVEDRV
uniref:Reverse transcriptase domain-containing protein n=1 Tax=Cajanus cajan TaxID=3821 RepID=A0A151SJC5_CAJCA|nr:hypothetical protein KK1_001102 [Cajanus cajan]